MSSSEVKGKSFSGKFGSIAGSGQTGTNDAPSKLQPNPILSLKLYDEYGELGWKINRICSLCCWIRVLH